MNNSTTHPHGGREQRIGLACAIGAHTLWGLFPMYWKQLSHVPSLELMWHRVLWAFVISSIFLAFLLRSGPSGDRAAIVSALRDIRVWRTYATAAVLIAINWFAFLWAVNNDHVLEASLGYYINPLLNVLLGVVILGERLAVMQWTAVGIAAIGVALMSVVGGGIPWVSIAMAMSFALYGLVKKRAQLPALVGLWFELAVLVGPAAMVIAMKTNAGGGALNDATWFTRCLLVGGGLVTILPLWLFATAVRRVALSTIGILQYIGPTLQFLVGAFVFGEPLDRWRIAGFAFVWLGLAVFLVYPMLHSRLRPNRVHA